MQYANAQQGVVSRRERPPEKLNVRFEVIGTELPLSSKNDTNAGGTIAGGKSTALQGVERVAKQRINGP